MPGKIFVNYRRDDARDMAARIRDRLAAMFGDANVFMDVDDLLAGQRFDKELEKALDQTDVFLAVIGPRWTELLGDRQGSGERDYVREEIAGALQRGIVVIPVLIERTPLPRADAVPDDMRDLVLHQKHVVTHERFGRDVEDLAEAIRFAREAAREEGGGRGATVRWVGAAALGVMVLGGVIAYRMVAHEPGIEVKSRAEQATKSKADAAEQARQEEIRQASEIAAKKADGEAQVKRAAEEAERQRLAVLKAEHERKRAEEYRQRMEAAAKKADELALEAEATRKRQEPVILQYTRTLIDRLLDPRDRELARQAEYTTWERNAPGQAGRWRNPATSHHGVVLPGDFHDRAGYRCRDFDHVVSIADGKHHLRGTACREVTGHWWTVN